MTPEQASQFGYTLFYWIVLATIAIFLLMLLFLCLGWYFSRSKRHLPLCPYTGAPLHHATDLSFDSQFKLYQFLAEYPGYDNPQIRLSRALVCRDTGRIFPECINFFGRISLDWSFLRKRHSGHWVSWGSLSTDQKRELIEEHRSLEGFQTEVSSQRHLPRDISTQYSYASPGPLYVDIETRVLLGWKRIPDSEIEVLIVQLPKQKTVLPRKKNV